MKRMRLLLVSLAFAIVLLARPATASNCDALQKCGLCVDDPQCGWCDLGETGLCTEGNTSGPLNPLSCSEGLWKFDDCIDEDKCVWAPNCTECVQQNGCGWCDTHCVAGDTQRPSSNVTCYNWDTTSCKISCNKILDCEVCSTVLQCTWCTNTGSPDIPSCNNITEIIENPSLCSEGSWISDPETCPTETPCSSFPDCQSCIGAPNEACGWCKSSQRCQNASLPASDCNDLQRYSCEESCYDFTNCTDCIKHTSCGWCATNAKCYALNATGYCPFWVEGDTALCPTCTNFTECSSCVANECWWCQGRSDFGVDKGTCGPSENTEQVCYNTTCPTPSPSPSITPSSNPTHRITRTSTSSASSSVTLSPSVPPTPSSSQAGTPPSTPTPSFSLTLPPTMTPSSNVTKTPSPPATSSPSSIPSASSSASNSISSSHTSQPTPFPSSSASLTALPTLGASESTTPSASFSSSQNPTQTSTPSLSMTPSISKTRAPMPSATPSPTVSQNGGIGNLSASSITFISLSGAFCFSMILGFAIYLFYHRYWRRKHYFEVLR